MAWATSDRAKRLPSNWSQLRDAVKRRARGRCEAALHAPGCDGRGAECDHVRPGDDHSLANLAWLSHPCHKAKTDKEAAARNRGYATARRRPSEQHPGSLRGQGAVDVVRRVG